MKTHKNTKLNNENLIGNITCPECDHKQAIEIPTKSCLAFYKCEKCKHLIQAKESCCVFCDYGDRKCPTAEHT